MISSPIVKSSGFSWSGQNFQCADCTVDNPEWASLNRGVLICSECCYVHRNLGRRISHVRSLQKGNWNKNQLELMYVLYSNGSNSIWEHTLLDPLNSSKTRRKPKPHDPVLPVKESFIKEKYANSAFTLRPSKDEEPINQDDLNRQLWSCVRTSHVITTLRLLALGADPNYADAEKRNSALHVAAKEGQELQVELLCIYGADAGQLNASELLPSEIAKLENNQDLAARLEDLRFEVTDRLSMFLCGRKPDHLRKQDFLVPELIVERPLTREVDALRRRLSVVPSHCFERIVQDVYDEVDRRETVASWNAVMQGVKPINLGNDEWVAVFLPPNPEMTATRNQLRQKLAKCGVKEFATLVIDILKEAKRRHYGLPPESEVTCCRKASSRRHTKASNDGAFDTVTKDYDDVPGSSSSSSRTSGSLSQRGGGATVETVPLSRLVSVTDYVQLKERVQETEQKLLMAEKNNESLQLMLTRLQSDFERLAADNRKLRSDLNALRASPTMGAHRRKSTSNASSSTALCNVQAAKRHDSVAASSGFVRGIKSRFESDPAVNRLGVDDRYGYGLSGQDLNAEPPPGMNSNSTFRLDNNVGVNNGMPFQRIFDESVFPDKLIVETERLTKAIKYLLADAQFNRLALHAPDHAYKIALQVGRIVATVPPGIRVGDVTVCLERIKDATVKLSAKCNMPTVDPNETCDAAYDVAKAAKNLLLTVHER